MAGRERQALIDALAGDARRRAGSAETPSAEELLAYHEGRLGAEEEARIGRILVADPEAARMLLDLVELAEAQPPAEGAAAAPADFAAAAAWRRLAAELPAAPAPAVRRAGRPGTGGPARRGARRAALAGGAGRFLRACWRLGLGFQDLSAPKPARLEPAVNPGRTFELPAAGRAADPRPSSCRVYQGRACVSCWQAEPACPSYDAELKNPPAAGRLVDRRPPRPTRPACCPFVLKHVAGRLHPAALRLRASQRAAAAANSKLVTAAPGRWLTRVLPPPPAALAVLVACQGAPLAGAPGAATPAVGALRLAGSTSCGKAAR